MTSTEKPDPRSKEGRVLKRKGDRRAFLAAAAGAAVGATAATLLPEVAGRAHAQVGSPLLIGQVNDGEDQTTALVGTAKGHPDAPDPTPNVVLVGRNVAGPLEEGEAATGVAGVSQHGEGVMGVTWGDAGQAGVTGFAELPGADPTAPPQGPAAGVRGHSGTGPGVEGTSLSGPGVVGHSNSMFGVAGQSEGAPGVMGQSQGSHGVAGVTQVELPPHPLPSTFVAGVAGASFKPGVEPGPQPSPADFGDVVGVLGVSGGAAGVQGISRDGWGVLGVAPGDAPAVCAMSGSLFEAPFPVLDGGVALAVAGKAVFSTAGSGTVPRRADAVEVSNPAVTADSHITVTFTDDPGGTSVAWVERQPGTGFIVHLSGRPRRDVPFTYLIVEPAPPPGP